MCLCALEAFLGFNCEVALYMPGHNNLVLDACDTVASLFFLTEIHNLMFVWELFFLSLHGYLNTASYFLVYFFFCLLSR